MRKLNDKSLTSLDHASNQHIVVLVPDANMGFFVLFLVFSSLIFFGEPPMIPRNAFSTCYIPGVEYRILFFTFNPCQKVFKSRFF